MGFVYSHNGLCCDFCGKDQQVSKIACPYGYCQAWACCPGCKAKKLHLLSSCTNQKKTHKEICKPLHLEFMKYEQQKQDLINSGKFLRIAAECFKDKVKVIFKGKDTEKTFLMSHKTYDSIPLGKNAIIEDYQVLGDLIPCQS